MKNKVIRYTTALMVNVALLAIPALAAENEAIAAVNNLSDFVFLIIKAVGGVFIGLGVMQLGTSLKNRDPSGRAEGILSVVGGLVVFFAKEILSFIAGGV